MVHECWNLFPMKEHRNSFMPVLHIAYRHRLQPQKYTKQIQRRFFSRKFIAFEWIVVTFLRMCFVFCVMYFVLDQLPSCQNEDDIVNNNNNTCLTNL